jgi:hypothetical protein
MIARFLGRGGLRKRGNPGPKSRGPDQRALAFARGIAVGALFGAAVAGSRMWRRGRDRGLGGRSQSDEG